ncbi:MAG TPA: ABC transporter substrate-binding protein [Anaerolineales bacterium]|nr:ABC transporter substrate-binding protein [Anaerolineales bacterium]
MFNRKNVLALLSLLLVAAFVLSACQPQVQEIIKTVEVEKQVEVVKTVEVEKEVEVIKTEIVEVERGAFSTPHPILGDLKVRQAMAYCTNKLELVQSVYTALTPEEQEGLVMNTFIAPSHWAYAGNDNISIYPYDPEKGKALLEEAGWTLAEGADFRTNEAGEELNLKFTTTTATFRQTWAAVWEAQMAACGMRIVRLHAPASWWFGDTTGLARRDFELGAFAWVGQVDPGGQTLWACDQIPSPDNGWEGQNYMGWCNEKASVGIKNANNTLIKDERVQWYTDVQSAYTDDVPAIPLFNRLEASSTRADFQNFKPTPGEEYSTWNAGEWAVPGSDTVVYGLTQEPASMFGLVEDAFVVHVVLMSMGMERSYTTLNYDFQPLYLKQIPTIESGQAQNNDVEVSEGDMVVDANGDVIELAAGASVVNAAGEVVDYTGGTITMKQLVVNYEYRDDLKWPDGEPLTAEDIALGFAIGCDKESGATSFITCDKTASYEANGLVATQTMLPGDQYPLYFARDFSIYPAHRVLSDGRTLAEVPAREWATLPEVAEQPWGFGPYMITDWVKGEKIVLEAHPYWYGGTPATPNLVYAIITPENAEAQLLGGQVDILGSETLPGITDTLLAAEQAGTVNNYANPSATWEHIDMALFVK